MALYWQLRNLKPEHRVHTSERLLGLRRALRKNVTEKKNVGQFKIATWNLMHFGGGGSYKRTKESLLYISEIIDHFDLVAIQEVKSDLEQLKDLIRKYLGKNWDYIVSDVTQGDAGNDERIAILFRKDKVRFGKVAGEIVLPPTHSVAEEANLGDDSEHQHHRQFARTPYFLEFRSGWFKFKLCSVHMHYGAQGGNDRKLRAAEIALLAKGLVKRGDEERAVEIARAKALKWDPTPSAANYILLGDFNIHKSRNDISGKALTENGFEIPEDIRGLPTNTGKEPQPFDQIALRLNDTRFSQGAGGVFDFRRHVYRKQDAEFYWKTLGISKLKQQGEKVDGDLEALTEYFTRYYRRGQMSDHLLMWTSFNTDYSDDYLEELSKEDAI